MTRHKHARDFYQQLGPSGLAALTDKKRTDGYLRFLKKNLRKQWHILDLACGYGRLTIPLAKAEYFIEGIDLSKNLISEALKQTKKLRLAIPFRVGNMVKLPYSDDVFDAAICMWSSFNELLILADQIRALKEMVRVTKKGGLIIIDLLIKLSGEKTGIEIKDVAGIKHSYYAHNKGSLENLFREVNIRKYSISTKTISRRKRLVVTINV